MNLQQFRKKYPEYNNISDEELSQKLYNKYYKEDSSFSDFKKKIGLTAQQTPQPGTQTPQNPQQKNGGFLNNWVKPVLKEDFVSAPETTLSAVTGMLSTPIAGLAALGTLATSGSLDKAGKTETKVSKALTYTPGDKRARKTLGLINKPNEWIHDAGKIAGDYVQKKTGSPAMAATAATIFDWWGYSLAAKAAGKFVPGGALPETKPWEEDVTPEAFIDKNKDAILKAVEDQPGGSREQADSMPQPEAIPGPPGDTVPSMAKGQEEAVLGDKKTYKHATERIGALKKMAHKINVEAPLKETGAPKTAFDLKNVFSKKAKEEEQGLVAARKNAKLFKYDKKVAPDVVLSAENPAYFKALPEDVKTKISPAVEGLKDYFKQGQKEYAEYGVHLDFKKRILDDLDKQISAAGKADPEKVAALKEARKSAQSINFVHIPSSMWFEKVLHDDPAEGSRVLKLLADKKRKTFKIQNLIDKGLVKKENIHPADIIASYARRKGNDFALLNLIKSAKEEGLASLEKKPGMVQVPGYIAPVLSKYWVKRSLADTIYDLVKAPKSSSFDHLLSKIKMIQFYNPVIMPMYDVAQQAMAMGAEAFKLPKYWVQGARDMITKSPKYWEALDNGIASKPFNATWDEFKSSLDLAKKSYPEIGKGALKDIAKGYPLLKDAYHLSWNIAWKLDEFVRMGTNRYFLDKGLSPHDAAQAAASFHSDYASVPATTRRGLNKVFFTPTFKITMGKLLGRMVKGAFEVGKSALKGEKADHLSKVHAKGLINALAIIEGADLWMTKKEGFKREEWGRKYSKSVRTPDGKRKDLVLSWSAPINMFLKYFYRADEAYQTAQPGEGVKDFLEKNRWEIHPLWRTLYEEFIMNKESSGKKIVEDFDPPRIKAEKRILYFAKQMVPITKAFDRDKRDAAAQKEFAREASKAFAWLTSQFAYKYMRTPKDQELKYRFLRLKKTFMRDLYAGKMTPERTATFKKDIGNIFDQIKSLKKAP